MIGIPPPRRRNTLLILQRSDPLRGSDPPLHVLQTEKLTNLHPNAEIFQKSLKLMLSVALPFSSKRSPQNSPLDFPKKWRITGRLSSFFFFQGEVAKRSCRVLIRKNQFLRFIPRFSPWKMYRYNLSLVEK